MRQSVVLSVKVSKAIAKSVDVDQVVRQWAVSHPEGSQATPQEARAWAEINVQTDPKDLEKALLEIYAVGALLGNDAAKFDLAEATIRKAPDSGISVDWDNWKPGNHPADALVRAKGGLKTLLDRVDQTIKGVDNTTLQRIGTKLADALKLGKSNIELAKDLQAVVGDPVRSLTIAHTEMNRALNAQKVQDFKDQGIEQQEWLCSDPCDICQENEGEVRTIGDEYPSGDDQPPAHVNCNCTLIPVVPFGGVMEMDQEDEGEPDLSQYEPQAVSQATEIAFGAAMLEPATTELFQGVASAMGGKMIGLQHKLKTKESLTRKIDDRMKTGNLSAQDAANSISDSLRYTMMFDPKKYSAGVNATLTQLRAQGFKVKAKNYWIPASPYKGINAALTSPDGKLVELQFHTPKSLLVKEHANHYLYEKQRVLDENSKGWADYQKQMIRNSQAIPTPKGADLIDKSASGSIRKALSWA
jgi:SPP1 gp7 family putative phage head morphogenesis protein